jgi:hypothetical protein
MASELSISEADLHEGLTRSAAALEQHHISYALIGVIDGAFGSGDADEAILDPVNQKAD